MAKAKIALVGATGYTGVECLRLLVKHESVDLVMVTSRTEQGRRVDDYFPSLRGYTDLCFSDPDEKQLADCDLVLFATPNGIAMKSARALLAAGTRLIDLAADFRIKNVTTWSKWYGMEHDCPDLLEQAVYGLPEWNREQVKQARLLANPGCYPTAVQLALMPLLEKGLIDENSIVADCKSGVSGAGRGASVATLLAECSESVKAYAVSGHRHQPEIEQGLSAMAGKTVNMVFVPHLMPMIRGIHATLYVQLTEDMDIYDLYCQRYRNEPFVDVMPEGVYPETRSVRGGNVCRLLPVRLENNRVVILSVIDNLVKGAAGQAIQNMNLMLGLAETTGLDIIPLAP